MHSDDLTDDELDLLEGAASEATGGPWEADEGLCSYRVFPLGFIEDPSDDNLDANVRHIVTATPDVVRRMVAELRRLRRKQYLVFAGENHHAIGGPWDYVASFESTQEAIAHAQSLVGARLKRTNSDGYEIVHSADWTVVARCDRSALFVLAAFGDKLRSGERG